MSEIHERSVSFECQRSTLFGILHESSVTCDTGVILLVGGPQYRVGSHRMFLEMARDLADGGYPVLRFDFRGMGDSAGEFPGFERLDPDIGAAVQFFVSANPSLSRIVLVGLCDGATAGAIYAPNDPRITDLVLLNPWAHTEEGRAKAYLWHYYPRRLLQADFWRSLWRGKVRLGESMKDLLEKLSLGLKQYSANEQDNDAHYIIRMRRALGAFDGNALIIASEKDLTASEFLSYFENDAAWKDVRSRFELMKIPGADHTLSSEKAMAAFMSITKEWLCSR